MEALEPGKPLSFLDHRIQCGNSLLGATPALLREGIPDDAFKPIEGDDKKVLHGAAQAEQEGARRPDEPVRARPGALGAPRRPRHRA